MNLPYLELNWRAAAVLFSLILGWPVAVRGDDLDIVLSEIHYHPFDGDPAEFIELHNRGTAPVNLGGWTFAEGVRFRFVPGTYLDPGTYLVISPDAAAFSARYPGVTVLGNYEGKLDNGGEVLSLKSAAGRVISRVHFLDSGSWPGAADGLGPSLELLVEEGDIDRPMVWAPSRRFGGTPGAPNTRSAEEFPWSGDPRPALRLNEILPALGDEEGFLEIHNSGDLAMSLDGYQIVDAAGGAHILPSGARVEARSFLLVPGRSLGFTLRPDPNRYALLGRDGGTLIDSIETPVLPSGHGLARYPDGDPDTVVTPPTPGAPNSWTPERRIVINEIFFAPRYEAPAGDCVLDCSDRRQWIEISNRSADVVGLSGWSLSGGVDYAFEQGVRIQPGAHLVICASATSFADEHPDVPVLAGEWTRSLGHRSDKIVLRDALGNQVDRVRYGNGKPYNDLSPVDGMDDRTFVSSGWPTDVADSDRSIELVNPSLENSSPYSWRLGPVGGTPGARNSRYVDDPSPVVEDVTHSPAVPTSAEGILVTCKAHAVGIPSEVNLLWRVEGQASDTEVPMNDDGFTGDGAAGDSSYGAWIPPQASGSILSWRIEVISPTGVSAIYPPRPSVGSREPRYLCEVDDDPPLGNGSVDYRIIMSRADLAELEGRQLRSDVLLNATFIGNGEIHHLVGIRYRGETSRNRARKSYHLEFHAEDPFLGCRSLNLNGSGTVGSNPQSALQDFLSSEIFRRAGLPYVQEWPVNLYFRGGVEGDLQGRSNVDPFYVRKESFNEDFLARYFGGSDGGNLYRALDPQSGVGTGNLSYRGADPASYAAVYEKRSNEDEDDYSDLVELTRAFDATQTPDAQFQDEMYRLLDVRQWAAFFAVQDFITNIDGGIQTNNGEDYFLYRVPVGAARPDAGLWLVLPWDQDESFDDATAGLFLTDVAAARRFIRSPPFAALYLDELRALSEGPATRKRMQESMACVPRIYPASAAGTVTSSLSTYVDRRLTLLGDQIPSVLDAAVSVSTVSGVELVSEGATWSYFRGVQEPSGGSLDWTLLTFADAAWPTGASGFGYGDGDDATQLGDMRAAGGNPGYYSLYIRKRIEIPDPSEVGGLSLVMDYDDAFVAYLNGVEIARSPMIPSSHAVGESVPYDTELGDTVNHEASRGGSGARPPEPYPVASVADILRAGTNVLAIHGLNSTRDSSDFSLIPELLAVGGPLTSGAGWGSRLVVTGASSPLEGRADATSTQAVRIGGTLATITRRPPSGGPPYTLSWRADVPFPIGESVVRLDAFPDPQGVGIPVDSRTIRVLRVSKDPRSVAGRISGATTWTPEDGPYILSSGVEVQAGASLTIEAGTLVYCKGGATLTVSGLLEVNGTEERPVVLSALENGARWGGIVFNQTGTAAADPTHVLRHVEVELAGVPAGQNGCLAVRSSKLLVEGSRFALLSAPALDARDSRLKLLGCVFEDCRGGVLSAASEVEVDECRFLRTVTAPAVSMAGNLDGPCRISRSLFEGGVDGVRLDGTSAEVLQNVFRRMRGTACAIRNDGARGPSTVEGNLIHEVGTGIDLSRGAHVADGHHNTVVFCETGMHVASSAGSTSRAAFHSTIFWGNARQLAVEEPFDLTMTYSLVGGETVWPGIGNITGDPGFRDLHGEAFQLSTFSPCRGAGQDASDMGAGDAGPDVGTRFIRGDANSDGDVNLSDAIAILGFLFQGQGSIDCQDAGDASDNGLMDLTDAIYLLNYLFRGAEAVPPPYPEAGIDPTPDELPCP